MRFLQIFWTLCKYTLLHKFTQHREKILGERLKLAFEELGLSFIKIGQILSMRYDLFSPKDCEALQKLLDAVNPIAFEDVLGILEKEYQKPWNKVFAKLYTEPLGSASISQVHRAELFDGTQVAVKIKRPNVDVQFLDDIKILKKLARMASFLSPQLRHLQICDLVDFFESWIQQDLDFVQEVSNMKKVKEQYHFGETHFRHDLGRGVFIAPFENLCTANIIVMDFVDGIPLSQKEEIAANPDYDIEKSVKTYINAAMRNWLRDDIDHYFFQADPHLSNILALPHGDVANIDCGLIARLSKKEMTVCKNLLIAVYMQNINKTLKIVEEITEISHKKYANSLKLDLEEYLEKSKNAGLGFWFLELIKILIKHQIKFPLFLTTFGRMNIVLDGLVFACMPRKTTIDILGEELKQAAMKEAFKNVAETDWLQVVYSVSEQVKQSPTIITQWLENPLI